MEEESEDTHSPPHLEQRSVSYPLSYSGLHSASMAAKPQNLFLQAETMFLWLVIG